MKILMDTSAYVGFKLNFKEIVETVASAELVLFSAIVLGELLFGFRNGTKFKKKLDELHELEESGARTHVIGWRH